MLKVVNLTQKKVEYNELVLKTVGNKVEVFERMVHKDTQNAFEDHESQIKAMQLISRQCDNKLLGGHSAVSKMEDGITNETMRQDLEV